MQTLTLALIQADLHWHDAPANRDMLANALQELPRETQLAVLPEMFTSGFTMQPEDVAEGLHGPTLDWMRHMAQTHELTLTGSYVVREAGQYFNRLIWMPPDGEFGWYDKRHLFRMAGEHRHYAPGRERRIFVLDEWRICPLICYDLRFPVFSRGIDEYDLLLYVANWPAARRSAWTTLLPARAVENLCYVAGVNRTGTDANGIEYAGDSGAWDHLGRALAQAGNLPENIAVTLDGDALLRYRQKFPAHDDADRFRLLDD